MMDRFLSKKKMTQTHKSDSVLITEKLQINVPETFFTRQVFQVPNKLAEK